MTSADGKQLMCFKCGKPDRAPNIVPYYTQAGYVWAHQLCMHIPEVDFATHCEQQR